MRALCTKRSGIERTKPNLHHQGKCGRMHAQLQKILSNPKDPVTQEEKTGVIYNIQCKECDSHYVGQTGRRLAERIHEHQLAVRRHDENSLISQHMDRLNHIFKWDNVSILSQAKSRNAREFLEAWHSDTNSINRHIELNHIYIPFKKDNRKPKKTARPSGQAINTQICKD